ncbi:methyltransferase domain-containing protein [Breznakiella homolactica]|uniref:Methyltransferase domain-containing protein n=1 Tax=Breznakiella homolactica TaxID=2798577 RepID=A0A7T8BAA5_9SPIR|nr:methyltransferase domain-containing protein [Breznakiella homolactica]QQO08795.1 methyltransferase domain-containing protein [Breznakiella homolactica]
MPAWDPSQYLKFQRERTQPAIDLAARISLGSPKKVLDVGCGPGNSTAVLAERFPGAEIIGIDNSPDMIQSARKKMPAVRFECVDAAGNLASLGGGFDVVFSNACIQWIPDHRGLLPRLMGLLAPGGVLAVQTPMNYKEPIHIIIEEMIGSKKWKTHITNPRVFYNLLPGDYYDLLSGISGNVSLWETTYYHILQSHEDIMEWYRGTGLRPYLEALPEDLRPGFESDVFRRVAEAYPVQENGSVIFRFPRFFFTAEKLP